MKKSNNQYFWQRRWFKISAAIVAVPLVLGLAFFAWYQFRDNQVETKLIAAADSLDIPGSWEVIGQDFNGSIECFTICKSYSRRYRVQGEKATDLVKELVNIIEKENYEVTKISLLCDQPDKQTGFKACGVRSTGDFVDVFSNVNQEVEGLGEAEIEVSFYFKNN